MQFNKNKIFCQQQKYYFYFQEDSLIISSVSNFLNFIF